MPAVGFVLSRKAHGGGLSPEQPRAVKRHTIEIGGVSPIDNMASLANAGVIYIMLKPWGERGKSENLRTLYEKVSQAVLTVPEANSLVLVPPPIPGLGLSGGFQMQINLTDGFFDYQKLQNAAYAVAAEARKHPGIRMALTPLPR